jgi:conjugative relaxase-like TrwC/TraI family protein
MVSMSGAMSGGAASSYYEKDNYYMKGDMSEKGEWFGEGADKLGLKGDVSIDDFKAVLHGYDPSKLNDDNIKTLDQFAKTEASLGFQMDQARKEGNTEKILSLQDKISEYNGLHKEFDKSLPEGAKLVRDGHDKDGMTMHRGAFDITFSAPKSVSLVALVGGDARVTDVHKEAVNTAMSYVQDYFAQTRVRDGEGGRDNVNTGNLTVAQFTHYTARGVDGKAPDPDMHTHNSVANLTFDKDGNAMSLEPQQIYTAQKLSDQIYQNELARGLEKIGYATTWNKNGENHTVEIKGVSQEVNDQFSKRTFQIADHIAAKEAELGRELTKSEKEIASLEIRSDKEVQQSDLVREDWDKQLKELGFNSKEEFLAGTKNQTSDKILVADGKEAVEAGVRGMADQKSVFTNHEVMFEALKNSHGNESVKNLDSIIRDGSTKAVALDATDAKNTKTEKFSSQDIVDAETRILSALEKGKGKMEAVTTKDGFKEITQDREAFTKENGLKEGQKESLENIVTSKDKYVAIVGDAGTGKTTMLGELKNIVDEKMGNKVELHGIAPMGTAAAGMQEKGIASQTVDAFLLKTDSEKFNDGKQHIIIVDEASTLSTEKFAALVELAEKSNNVKMVMMGDDKQMQAVGSGAMFKHAVREEKIDFSRMTESVRQNNAAEGVKEIVESFKHVESVEKGMEKLKESGRLIEAEVKTNPDGKEVRDVDALKEKFVTNVTNDIEKMGDKEARGIANTNAERSDFGEKVREGLQEKGLLSAENHSIKVLEAKNMSRTDSKLAMSYEKGDIMISSSRQLDMKAKTEATVVGINKEDNQVQLQYENKHGIAVERWVDAEKGEKFNTYREVEKTFNEGERITFTNRDDKIGVKNGEFATIKSIGEDGKIIAEKDGGKMLRINSEESRHFDQGYIITPNKSQGMSFGNSHIYVDSSSGLNNHNAVHVSTSRTTNELSVYTDNSEVALDKFKEEQLKENHADYANRNDQPTALERDMLQETKDEISNKTESAKSDFDQKIDDLLAGKEMNTDEKSTEATLNETAIEKSFDDKIDDLKSDIENKSDEAKSSFDEKVDDLLGREEKSGEESKEEVERAETEREFNQEVETDQEKEAEKEKDNREF